MPDNDLDPAASTQQFQAFFDNAEPEPRPRWVGAAAVAGAAVGGLAVVLALAWLVLGG